MKPTTPVKFPSALLVALLLIVTTLLLPGRAAASAGDTTVNVDYVIALLDSGMERAKIVERIESKGLTFRLAPGDMARLRAAGADEKLIDAVVDHAAVLEGQGQAPPPAQGTDGWGRPSRMGNSGAAGSGQGQAAPPADEGQQYQQQNSDDGQGIEETPYGGGSYGYYPGYYTGYYDSYYGYPYPYYYSYPYGASFYYSSPYYGYYYPHHYYYGYYGHGGGGGRTVPRGTHSMGSPRGGGSHSAPRPAPRGSHH